MLFLLFTLHCLCWWSNAARVPLLQFDALWLLWTFWSYGLSQLLFGSAFVMGVTLWLLTILSQMHCRTVGWLDGAVASPFCPGQLDDLKFRGDPRHPIVLALRRFHSMALCSLPMHRVPIRWRREFQQVLYECQHAVVDLTPGFLIAFAYRACMFLAATVSDPSALKSSVDRLFAEPDPLASSSSSSSSLSSLSSNRCLRQRTPVILTEQQEESSTVVS